MCELKPALKGSLDRPRATGNSRKTLAFHVVVVLPLLSFQWQLVTHSSFPQTKHEASFEPLLHIRVLSALQRWQLDVMTGMFTTKPIHSVGTLALL